MLYTNNIRMKHIWAFRHLEFGFFSLLWSNLIFLVFLRISVSSQDMYKFDKFYSYCLGVAVTIPRFFFDLLPPNEGGWNIRSVLCNFISLLDRILMNYKYIFERSPNITEANRQCEPTISSINHEFACLHPYTTQKQCLYPEKAHWSDWNT